MSEVSALQRVGIEGMDCNNCALGIQRFLEKKGLQKVAKRYNIDNQNIIAIGDGDNDICLIKDCGIGISFCSSNPTLNIVANKVIQEKSFSPLLEFIN